MLTPEQLQSVGETLLPQLDRLNTWISNDMIRRFLTRFGRGEDVLLTGTDEWQVWVLRQSSDHLEAVQKHLAEETGKSRKEIARIFKDAGITALENDIQLSGQTFLLQMSPALMSIIEDAYQRTNAELRNLTRTTAGLANQAFISAMDDAYWKVRTGAQSYTAAVAEAIDKLARVQADVRYPSGHVDHLEVATLRAVRTGTARSSGNCTLQQCREWGWNHVLVSEHIGARVSEENPIADHAGWQGSVYTIEGGTEEYPNLRDATGYPDDPLGLCGYNCRHSFSPFLPGVSVNPYDGNRIDTEKNRKAYELSQEQRRMERAIRAEKRKASGLKTAVEHCEDSVTRQKLQEAYDKSAERLTAKNKAYRDFCDRNGLKRYDDRLRAARWSKSDSAAASAKAGSIKAFKKRILETEKTADGIAVREVGTHIFTRAKFRGGSAEQIVDALTKPLQVGKIRTDRTKQYVGEQITVAINVDTGKLTTCWPTGSKKAEKLKKGE